MVEFRLLGPVQALRDQRPLPIGKPQRRAVLAALVVDAGHSVPTDGLVDRVWGGVPPRAARSALYSHLAEIRRVFDQADAPVLIRRDGGYAIDVAREDVDLFRFRDAVERARRPALTDQERVGLLRAALGQWRGEPLAGIAGDWAARTRAGCSRQRLDALAAWGRAELAVGNGPAVTGVLGEVAEAHPLAEPLVAVLVRAHAETGSPADALTLIERTRRLLADELGVDPGEELRREHEELLAADRRRSRSSRSPRGPGPPAGRRPLIGRERELRLLDAAAEGGLVLVTGPGGVGKTVLVQHWLGNAADRAPDGTLFVDLRGFHPDDDPVPPSDALRRLLVGLGDAPDALPDHVDDLVARFRAATAERRMIVVLDDVRSSAQVRPLLPAGRGSVTIVTSRRRLDGLVAGEAARVVELGPLAEGDAVTLLAGRGTTVPAARLRHLAGACGHLPLALTILSAQIGARPDRVLAGHWERPGAGELDLLEVEDGDLSIRRVLDATLRVLPVGDRRAVDLLGLWPGADLDPYAVAALLGSDRAAGGRLLDRLADLHVLEERQPGRYRMHDLVAAYCRERVAALPPDEQLAARTRLCRYALTLLRRLDVVIRPGRHPLPVDSDDGLELPPLDGPEDATRVIRKDGPTLLAVTRQAQRQAHAPYAWQLPYALGGYFVRRGSLSTRIELYQAALRLAPVDEPIRHALHNGEGIAQARVRRLDLARDCFEKALALAGDPVSAAKYANNLATVDLELGEFEAAEAHYLLMLRKDRPGEEVDTVPTLSNLAQVLVRQGREDEAIVRFQEALGLAEGAGDARLAGHVLSELGSAHAARGDTAAALRAFAAARRRAEEAADEVVQAEAYERAAALLPRGAPERHAWRQAAERLYRQVGDPRADQLTGA